MWKVILISSLSIVFGSCAEYEPKPFIPSETHINAEQQVTTGEIPELVQQAPILPEPEPPVTLEKYTVVVNEVPVKELLFALARDAKVNVDIDPKIDGVITINAVEQTLPQILDRVARQVELRYELVGDNLIVEPDEPFLRTYKIDYVNMVRNTNSTNTIATQISSTSGGGDEESGSGGGEGNNSTTDVSGTSNHHFWHTLVLNVAAILGEDPASTSSSSGGVDTIPVTASVIPNPESGILTVRATARQQEQVQSFLDVVLTSAKRQVLIQATILEVSLNDQYQAGIDWSFLNSEAGIDLISTTLTGVPVGTLSSLILSYEDTDIAGEGDTLNVTVSLLDEFGDVRVLSSPQLMVLNNQTAILKVVENVVYFDVDVEPGIVSLGGVTDPAIDTEAKTVPVGIVMTVTPQIGGNDVITLNVRPTISRVLEFVNDPNPELANANVTNPVPQIAVREVESMLRLTNGQIGVLGGLMQDETRDLDNSIPGFSRLPGVGRAFQNKTKEYFKTELVIFLRPIIINNPSVDSDLRLYKTFLEKRPVSAIGEGNAQ